MNKPILIQFPILLLLMLFSSIKSYSQVDCEITTTAVDSAIRAVFLEENLSAKHQDLTKKFDDLKFNVKFTFDSMGVFKDIDVMKQRCKKCTSEDKKYFKERTVFLISNIKGVKPCKESLKFILPVFYELYE